MKPFYRQTDRLTNRAEFIGTFSRAGYPKSKSNRSHLVYISYGMLFEIFKFVNNRLKTTCNIL